MMISPLVLLMMTMRFTRDLMLCLHAQRDILPSTPVDGGALFGRSCPSASTKKRWREIEAPRDVNHAPVTRHGTHLRKRHVGEERVLVENKVDSEALMERKRTPPPQIFAVPAAA